VFVLTWVLKLCEIYAAHETVCYRSVIYVLLLPQVLEACTVLGSFLLLHDEICVLLYPQMPAECEDDCTREAVGCSKS
jgi:hypothetical protein